jgi:hypothetical protein
MQDKYVCNNTECNRIILLLIHEIKQESGLKENILTLLRVSSAAKAQRTENLLQ